MFSIFFVHLHLRLRLRAALSRLHACSPFVLVSVFAAISICVHRADAARFTGAPTGETPVSTATGTAAPPLDPAVHSTSAPLVPEKGYAVGEEKGEAPH